MPSNFFAQNARDIAAGTAIAVVCALISVYFPVPGFICFLLLPLPVLFYRVKLGRPAAAAITIAALVLISQALDGATADIWMILGMLGLGFGLGDFLERDFSIEQTIGWACILVLTSGLVILVVLGNLTAGGPWGLMSEYIRRNLEMTAALYREIEAPEKNIRLLTESMDQLHHVLTRIVPALVAAGLLFAAWMNVLIARAVLRYNRMPVPEFGILNRWRAPENLVWAVIACALLIVMPHSLFKFAGLNGLIVLLPIYLFQGLAIVSFYFESKQMPVVLRVLIYVFIAIQQLLALIVVGLGFFDTWADFRRLGKNKNGEDKPSQ